MLWFIYNVLFAIGFTLMLPRFLLRMWRRGGYRIGFMQRLGVYGPVKGRLTERRRIWIHAVSVGEVFVAHRFIQEYKAAHPGSGFVLTVTTSTGHTLAESLLDAEDVLLYFPTDFPWVMNRVLDIVKPSALILTECELWPNLIRGAHKRRIPVCMISGRISERSYKGYRLVRVFFKRTVDCVALFCVQSDADRDRLLNLGTDASRIKVLGTVKYDAAQRDPYGEAKAQRILAAVGFTNGRPIIVGGATWPGEEAILLDIVKSMKRERPEVRLVLVPRHAERSAGVAGEIEAHGLTHVRRSSVREKAPASDSGPDVLLVDTTGELKDFYAWATAIFVGKSLTEHGGQNVIEPALFGKPIVVGPYTENFVSVMADFLENRAIIQVPDAAGLENALKSLVADPAMREAYGKQAKSLVERKRGVIKASVAVVDSVLNPGH